MHAQALINRYVSDVAARLPRSLRHQAAADLRTQLTELLDDAATHAGRSPDCEMVMETLRSVGPPNALALGYRSGCYEVVAPQVSLTRPVRSVLIPMALVVSIGARLALVQGPVRECGSTSGANYGSRLRRIPASSRTGVGCLHRRRYCAARSDRFA